MRVVVQRVTRAAVRLSEAPAGEDLGRIDRGLLVLLGIGHGDGEADAAWLIDKIIHLRVFPDAGSDNMNRALLDIGGGLLIVSQFTLYADCRKGRRPSFTDAMHPALAEPLYQRFLALARQTPLAIACGQFGAMMHVELVNDGPVTIWLDSAQRSGAPFVDSAQRSGAPSMDSAQRSGPR